MGTVRAAEPSHLRLGCRSDAIRRASEVGSPGGRAAVHGRVAWARDDGPGAAARGGGRGRGAASGLLDLAPRLVARVVDAHLLLAIDPAVELLHVQDPVLGV